MSDARQIVRWAPTDGRMVIAGTKKFSEALAEARRQKQRFDDSEKAEREKEELAVKRSAALENLRLRYSNLAKQVDDDELTLEQAEKEKLCCRPSRASSRTVATAIKSLETGLMTQTIDPLIQFSR